MKKSIKHSVFLHGVKDAQDIDEQVDYIQVQIDGCQDVLLRWQLMHQQVGIENNEPAEQQSSGPSEDQLHCVIVEEKPHKACNDQDPQASKQTGSELAEVSFRLESVGSEAQEHSRCENKGLKHYGVLIKCHRSGYRQRFQQSKSKQQVKIDGVLVTVHSQGKEQDKGPDSRYQYQSGTFVHKVFNGVTEHEKGRYSSGDDNLQWQDGVDLAEEIHPDVDARRRDVRAIIKIILNGWSWILLLIHVWSN